MGLFHSAVCKSLRLLCCREMGCHLPASFGVEHVWCISFCNRGKLLFPLTAGTCSPMLMQLLTPGRMGRAPRSYCLLMLLLDMMRLSPVPAGVVPFLRARVGWPASGDRVRKGSVVQPVLHPCLFGFPFCMFSFVSLACSVLPVCDSVFVTHVTRCFRVCC